MDGEMKKIIISVFGPDRPGILAAVSRILFEQNCNIENVTQTILQSEFSGSFIAEMPASLTADTLCSLLSEALTPMRLQTHVKYLETSTPALGGKPAEPFVITTRGPDRKGLVANVTRIIADFGVNVTHLQAVFKGGLNPNDNIMIYEVDVPVDIDSHAFHGRLRDKAAELGLIISIQHRRIFEAINRV
jgi:glycine cleavage system transcriptional repressor